MDLCAGIACDADHSSADLCDPADGQCKATAINVDEPCVAAQGTCTASGECALAGFEGCGEPSQRHQDGDFPPGTGEPVSAADNFLVEILPPEP